MQYRNELTQTILPFWMGAALDRSNGGIFTCLDREGRIYGTDKSVWFQGRALWTFSKAYNVIEKRPEYLEAARLIYDFLPKCTGPDGRMAFTVTQEGGELQKRRYYFSETFAAIGCAEYYKATGDSEALRRAEMHFDVAYRCYTGEIPLQPKFNPENYAFKALSPVMILLSTAQTMAVSGSARADEYRRIADECLHEILHGGYLTERALLEHVHPQQGFVDSPTGRIVNPGHSMEAAWFVMSQGLLSGNRETLEAGRKIIDLTLPLGMDEKHGGFIAFTDVLGKPPVQLEWDMKLWWPQCEAMIALRLAGSLFADERYDRLYHTLADYCERCFIDREYGEWYGYLHYDNTPSTTLKGNLFKGPFHIPRFYMLMTLMDETGGIEAFLK